MIYHDKEIFITNTSIHVELLNVAIHGSSSCSHMRYAFGGHWELSLSSLCLTFPQEPSHVKVAQPLFLEDGSP
jgi:hypothetical protein